ncbi:hypothetical protein FF011L_11860 [Roseimaritima multifibrata]|uniref:Uncharacterized protein n=1 Tax=Roseimaritima multifibrata TaxID=1930274 RepID=A0A517MC38_9BACT|nr:hypothetical protein FF011L_11860 [Roseimaritima multifibrata]
MSVTTRRIAKCLQSSNGLGKDKDTIVRLRHILVSRIWQQAIACYFDMDDAETTVFILTAEAKRPRAPTSLPTSPPPPFDRPDTVDTSLELTQSKTA